MPSVFISSTGRDLEKYRDAAVRACNELALTPVAMEFWEAMGVGATKGSLAKLERCNLFLGFFAHRYGYVEAGDPRSITEREFDHATSRGMARRCFVIKDSFPWPMDQVDQWDRQQAFKKRVRALLVAPDFTTVDDFHLQVYKALSDWQKTAGQSPRLAVVPRQLPAPPPDFLGRDDTLRALDEQRGRGKALFALQGMGGAGKKALALKFAERLTGDHPDGQIYLDLKGVDPEPLPWREVMAHVLRSFNPEVRLPDDNNALAGEYRSLLADKRVLLVLNNAAGAEQVEPLAPPAGCTLVLTSRKHFTLPGLYAHDIEKLAPADAVQLLRGLAPRLDEATAAAIAAQCECLPLALRLCGKALVVRKDLAPERFLQRFRDARLQMLSEVAASIRLSEESLPKSVRLRWCELSVLVGGFEAAWATGVWDLNPLQADDFIGLLIEYSLLDWDDNKQMYRLHNLGLDYAYDQLKQKNRGRGLVEAGHRHARCFLGVLGEADRLYQLRGSATRDALRLFDRAWPNVQAAFAWARGRTEDRVAQQLCVDLASKAAHLLGLRHHPQEQVDWLTAVVEIARRLGDRPGERSALSGLGNAYSSLGQQAQAIAHYEQALAVARQLGDRRAEGTALGNLGVVYTDLDQPQMALDFLKQHWLIADEVGDRVGEGNAMGNLGNAHRALNQLDQAVGFFQQHRTIAHEIGDRRGEASALANLGNANAELGRREQAIDYYQQALAIAREIGDRRGEANTCWNLGDELVSAGRGTEALPLMEITVRYQRDIGHPDAAANAATVEELRRTAAGGSALPPPQVVPPTPHFSG